MAEMGRVYPAGIAREAQEHYGFLNVWRAECGGQSVRCSKNCGASGVLMGGA